MNVKQMLTNGVFCPMPWTGLMYNFDGTVKNCIRSAGRLGNIRDATIEEILSGSINQDTQQRMLQDQPGLDCHTCYDLENGKKSFDIISDRIFYIRELKHVHASTYVQGNHHLKTIDVRWSNLCNFACVYCSADFSSQWANELNIRPVRPDSQQLQQFKDHIFNHAANLKHVYLAGGEPLLMKENLELLELLKQYNPGVNLRINTNLSKVDTRIFDLICEFKNVHWTVSVETMAEEFEYIRYGGSWQDFLDNLDVISNLDHKISFNMLHFLLNYRSIFQCIDYLRSLGFHANSFIAGALLAPLYLNIRHLPDHVLKSVQDELESRINDHPGYLLEQSLKNLLHYIQQPFERNLNGSLERLTIMDRRRNLDSSKIFTELYSLQQGSNHGQTI
jgi:MoaA/NifB/PqqE/SkfB family radical SAM enzyme